MSQSTEELRKQWKYEFDDWSAAYPEFQPVALVKSYDESPGYEMTRGHVFALKNGKYALVSEIGCSCYEASDASIEFLPTKHRALASLEQWLKEHKHAY